MAIIPVPKVDEHTKPAFLYLSLLIGILLLMLGAGGVLAILLGNFERRWWTPAVGMVFLASTGFQLARTAWKAVVKRASIVRTG